MLIHRPVWWRTSVEKKPRWVSGHVNDVTWFYTALSVFLKQRRTRLHLVQKSSPSLASQRLPPRHVQSAAAGDVSGPITGNTCWLTQIENTSRRGREELLPARGQLMSTHLPIITTLTERDLSSAKYSRPKKRRKKRKISFFKYRQSFFLECQIRFD